MFLRAVGPNWKDREYPEGSCEERAHTALASAMWLKTALGSGAKEETIRTTHQILIEGLQKVQGQDIVAPEA